MMLALLSCDVMEIGRSPGQLDALAEVRAELARSKRLALRKRTMVCGAVGVLLGFGFGYQILYALWLQPAELRAVVPDAVVLDVVVPDVPAAIDARAIFLANSASDEELVANHQDFFAAQARFPDAQELVVGVQRLATMVVEEAPVLPSDLRGAVARSVLVAMGGGACSVDGELLDLALELRRYVR